MSITENNIIYIKCTFVRNIKFYPSRAMIPLRSPAPNRKSFFSTVFEFKSITAIKIIRIYSSTSPSLSSIPFVPTTVIYRGLLQLTVYFLQFSLKEYLSNYGNCMLIVKQIYKLLYQKNAMDCKWVTQF